MRKENMRYLSLRSLLFSLFCILIIASQAQAVIPFFPNQRNLASDNTAAYLINKSGSSPGDTTLDIGDRLRGIIQIETLEDVSGGGGTVNLLGPGQLTEFTAIYDVTVVSKTYLFPGPQGPMYQFVFGPTDPSVAWADLPGGIPSAGTLIRFYEDPAKDFSRLLMTGQTDDGDTFLVGADIGTDLKLSEEAVIALSTGGSSYWDLGFTGPGTTPYNMRPSPVPGEGWSSFSIDNISTIKNLPLAANAGLFNVGLNLTGNSLGPQLGMVTTAFGGAANFSASGSLVGLGKLPTPFDFFGNVDFTLLPQDCSGSIGNFVWHDSDHDGKQGSNEPGIDGVDIHLSGTDSKGQPIALTVKTQTFDGKAGYYQFIGLCSGNYTVTVDLTTVPGGLQPTSPLSSDGTDNEPADSNDPSGTLVTITTDSSSNQTIDFGFISSCTATIGDFVWRDLNQNGLQDDDNSGLDGVQVVLTGQDYYGQSISKTFTTVSYNGQSGYYLFSGLCAGNYRVNVNFANVPGELLPTSPLSADGNDGTAFDSNDPQGTTVVLYDDFSPNLTVDFGFLSECTGSIGDFVWQDLNLNGLQDDGDSGIDGVQVLLSGTDAYGRTISASTSTMTSGGMKGYYQFESLCTGIYRITVNATTIPSGLAPTSPLSQDGNDGKDKDSNNPDGTQIILATDTTVNQFIDFGYVKPCTATVGDYVWLDINQNGIQDDGPGQGINTVQILLSGLDIYGRTVNQTSTTAANSLGESGYYEFNGICAGRYTVSVNTTTLPDSVLPTFPRSTDGNDGNTGDSNEAIGTTVTISSDDELNQSIDFGYYMPCTGTIGDFVWNDLDQDGVQDVGEPGIPGVTVALSGVSYGQSVSMTTITNASGLYQFTGLCTGSYSVTVIPPAGYTASPTGHGTAATDSNGSPAAVTLTTDNSTDYTIDFGFYVPCTGTIGDFVWNDLDQDGVQDVGEPGISGVTVTLSGTSYGQPVSMTTMTNASGLYQFTGLCTGSYIVTVMPPAGYTASPTGQGTVATDSNGSPASVTLTTDSSTDDTIDFGFYMPCTGTIGDFVWNDLDQDGVQDVGEPGIPGVKVNLSTGAVTATDAAGFYSFTGLCAGTYTVTVETPAGFNATLSNQGSDRSVDSNGSPAVVTLFTNSGSDFTIDFGFSKSTYGCTFTIGYWKNHAGFGPQPDVLTPLLPQYLGTIGGDETLAVTTAKIAYNVLSQNVYGKSDNGITKLYAQLLAAKLNVKAGSDPSAVAGIISQADKFLAGKSYSDWYSLSSKEQDKVFAWHNALDDYNNGLLGPGHCESQEVLPCVDINKQITVDGGSTWLDADTEATAAIRTSTGTASYRLVVNNCGQGSLLNIDIDDPALGISNYMIPSLAAGASTTITSSKISKLTTTNRCTTAGAFENVAFATATYNGYTFTAYDSAWLVCKTTNSCIDITKDISIDGGQTWAKADTQGTAPITTAPHAADYRITVKNCGNSTLSNVVLKDPDIGLTSYNIGTLYSGASKIYTYKQISKLRDINACGTSGSFLNTAFVSGTYNGITLADNDSAWLVCTGAASSGCSYTIGYWKTHTSYDGDKKRNNTWNACGAGGEKTMFFETGQSWYQILMTSPSESNAYYILAHQYIAAFLNQKAGADTSAINAELALAADLLSKYDGKPYKMSDISGAVREDFIRTAATLDMFNNGEIGPGHCK